jgi:hypothetical protein
VNDDDGRILTGLSLVVGLLLFLASAQRDQQPDQPKPPPPKVEPAKPKPLMPRRP